MGLGPLKRMLANISESSWQRAPGKKHFITTSYETELENKLWGSKWIDLRKWKWKLRVFQIEWRIIYNKPENGTVCTVCSNRIRRYDKNTLIVTNKKLTYQGTSFTKIMESTKSFLLSVSCFMENSNLHWPYGDVSEKQVLVNQL